MVGLLEPYDEASPASLWAMNIAVFLFMLAYGSLAMLGARAIL